MIITMKTFLLIILFACNAFAISIEDIDLYGETSYVKQKSESLVTTITMEYKIKLHEPNHKKYMFYVGGTVNPDYDHFGRTIRINCFTNFGLEF